MTTIPTDEEIAAKYPSVIEADEATYFANTLSEQNAAKWMRDLLAPRIAELEKKVKDLETAREATYDASDRIERSRLDQINRLNNKVLEIEKALAEERAAKEALRDAHTRLQIKCQSQAVEIAALRGDMKGHAIAFAKQVLSNGDNIDWSKSWSQVYDDLWQSEKEKRTGTGK